MPSGLGFPLAMASLFTLGWIVIQKAGTRTEAVADGLGALFLLSALLAVVALTANELLSPSVSPLDTVALNVTFPAVSIRNPLPVIVPLPALVPMS